jgi:hypothetical protein
MLRKLARLFTIKTRWEAYLVIYAIAIGAVTRGFHYLEAGPCCAWLRERGPAKLRMFAEGGHPVSVIVLDPGLGFARLRLRRGTVGADSQVGGFSQLLVSR